MLPDKLEVDKIIQSGVVFANCLDGEIARGILVCAVDDHGVDSRIATLVERQSRFVMLVRLGAKTSDDVVAALARQVKQLPKQMQASLTWDRGSELTSHAKLTLATNVKVYFCDPQSPWQRGSNENTNGLLRQYFPKGATFANVTQAQLNAVARELNSRPRKTLGYKTPAAIFAEAVAETG